VPAAKTKPANERNNPTPSKSRVPAEKAKPTNERNNPPPSKSRVPAEKAKPTNERNNPPPSKSRVPAVKAKPTNVRSNPPPPQLVYNPPPPPMLTYDPPHLGVNEQPLSLNDRLESYVERVRNLEAENKQLHTQLEDIARGQHNVENEENVVVVNVVYEAGAEELRRHLDVVTQEKAGLELDRDNAIAEYDDVRDQLSKMEIELETVQRNSARLYEQVQELLRRANGAEKANVDLLETVRGLECDNAKLAKDYKDLLDVKVIHLDNELKAVDKLLNRQGKNSRVALPSVKAVLLSVGGAVVIGASLYAGYWHFMSGGDWSFDI